MKSELPNPNRWDVCPPGLLHETAKVVPPNRGWLAGTLLAFVVVAAFVVFAYPSGQSDEAEQTRQALTNCQLVQQNMLRFVTGEIKDCSVRKKMGCHIAHCNSCCKAHRKAKKAANPFKNVPVKHIEGTNKP